MFKKIVDGIDAILGRNKTSEEIYNKRIAEQQKKINNMLKDTEKKQQMITDCSNILRECKKTFKDTIVFERSMAMEMRTKHYDTATHESRIKECAVGMLVADEALYKLKSIYSESEMNAAMNKLGQALRQVQRLNGNSADISFSTKKVMQDWCPDVLDQLRDDSITLLEVPEEIRNRIDYDFLSNMMSGDDFDMCMYKANLKAKGSLAADVSKKAAETVNKETAPETADSQSVNADLCNKLKDLASEQKDPLSPASKDKISQLHAEI